MHEQLLRILAEGSREQLGLIQSASEDLVHSAKDSPLRQALERVRASAWELGTLISDITDYHAFSTGQWSEVDCNFDLRVTLEGIRSRLTRGRPQADWMALSRIRHDVPTLLRGKPARLQEVLLGATAFILDRCPQGTLRIDVAKSAERGEDIELVFRCALRGQEPFAADDVSRFRQLIAAPDDQLPLLRPHLRLQLAKHMVLASGGTLVPVADNEGIAEFEVRLPFAVRAPAEQPVADATPPPLRGRRVLIADGAAARRARTEGLVRLWGLQAATFERGHDALESLESEAAAGRPWDLALIDSELADMGGVALGRRVRANPALGATRLLLTFGVGMRGDAAIARDAGFAAYLPRTISTRELREALNVLLARGEPGHSEPILTRHSLADVRLEGIRILVACAEPLDALILESVLKRKGFQIDRVTNIAAAAEQCEHTSYELVILDLGSMPSSDLQLVSGFWAVLEERGPIPFAVLVEPARNDASSLDLSAVHADGVFSKPVDLERICTFCESVLCSDLAAATVAAPATGQTAVSIVSHEVPESDPVVFEPRQLDDSTMGIQGLKMSVLDSYLEEMPRRLEAIAESMAGRDLAATDRLILSAQAMSLMVGAFATARCFVALGTQLQEGRVHEAQAMLVRLRTEAERGLDAIRETRQSLMEELKEAA
jgi:CheY-like chemotaxis protein